MRVFEEKQRFNQIWIYAVLLFIFTGLLVQWMNILERGDPTKGFLFGIVFLVFLAIAFSIYSSQLKTRIDNNGIRVKFHPFSFTKKKFRWEEIKDVYVRRYAPIAEYGGWGIRGKAYNTSGNYGIQIVTKSNKNFLIGTQQPDSVKRILKKFKETKN